MAPTFIQHKASEFGSSASARTLAFTSNVTAGSLLWAAVGTFNSGITVSVSDNLNGSWTQIGGYIVITGAGNNRLSMWYVANSAAGACTVTYTPSATAFFGIEQQENGGITHTSPVRANVQNDNGGNTSSTPTTTNVSATAGDLVAAAYAQGSTTISSCTVASPFTLTADLHGATGEGLGAAYDLSAAGAEGATWTLNAAVRYAAMAVAFIPASVAPTAVVGGVLAGGVVTARWAPGPELAGGVLAGGVVTKAGALPRTGGVLAGGVTTRTWTASSPAIGGVLAGGVVTTSFVPGIFPAIGGVLAGGVTTRTWTASLSLVGAVLAGGVVVATFAPGRTTAIVLPSNAELQLESIQVYNFLQTAHCPVMLFTNAIVFQPDTVFTDLVECTFNTYARRDTFGLWLPPVKTANGVYALSCRVLTWNTPAGAAQNVAGWALLNSAGNAWLWGSALAMPYSFGPTAPPLELLIVLDWVAWRYVP